MPSPKETPNEVPEYPVGHYAYKKDLRTALPQFIAVSVKNLLLLVYGMTLGFPTILIPAVTNSENGEKLQLQISEISWIGSINLIVVPLGCALSGVVTAPIGRRRAMQIVNLPFFAAWLVFHYATTTNHLYTALVLTGLAGGLLEAPVLTYVAEITQPHLRGALTATSSMCIIVGVFTQFLFGLLMGWRTVALVNITFTILAVIALCFIPESPHWLVSKKRYADARQSLQWLRGWTTPADVESELTDIKTLYQHDKVKSENAETVYQKLSNYSKKTFLIPFGLVCYAFFVGHFSGMTTLQTYAVRIFQILEAPINKYYATLILGVLQIVGSGVCVLMVKWVGKRPLTFVSTIGAAVCCALVAVYDGYIHYVMPMEANIMNATTNDPAGNKSDNPYSWVPTTFLMLLAFISHTGIRLLPWILIGEVFPANTRSGAAGLASAVGYILGFLTNKIYISMVNDLSVWGTYGLYGIVCLSGCIAFYFILPETEGKSLIEIENYFASKRVSFPLTRRPVSVAHLQDVKGTANPVFQDDTV